MGAAGMLPEGTGTTAVFDGMGQEHLPMAVGSMLANPAMGVTDADILDFSLAYAPDLIPETFNDVMFERLEAILGGMDPIEDGPDYDAMSAFAEAGIANASQPPVDFLFGGGMEAAPSAMESFVEPEIAPTEGP